MPRHRPTSYALLALLLVILLAACEPVEQEAGPGDLVTQPNATATETPPDLTPPPLLPEGIAVGPIPAGADLIISSVRHVLADPACLDENGNVDRNFITKRDCNRQIYAAGGLLPLRQLYALDIETGVATQLTNVECLFTGGQAVDSLTLVTNAACSDSDASGAITDADQLDLYVVDLATGELRCLTRESGLEALNNPDYSHANKLVLFSARNPSAGFDNHLFTVDLDGNLRQLTWDPAFMEFDCSWSDDGSGMVFNRLPSPWFSAPSQVWTADADGTNLRLITTGGPNPDDEPNFGPFPIGVDVDPDLSPDGSQVVISRLRTGTENTPFGVFELVIVDLETGDEQLVDSTRANMLSEWKQRGILVVRQTGGTNPIEVTQELNLYNDGAFTPLETFPYNVFPIGAYGGYWIAID